MEEPPFVDIEFSVTAPWLSGTRCKLDRAAEHIAALPDAIAEAGERFRHSVTLTRLPNMDVNVTTSVETRPPLLPVLLGEIAYNVRSALDLMVYDLATAGKRAAGHDTERKPVIGSQFPIEDSPVQFQARVTGRLGKRRNIKRYLQWVDPAYVAMIRQRQPFADCDWIRMLRDVSNQDKHRFMSELRIEVDGEFTVPEQPGEQAKPEFRSLDFKLHPWLVPVREAMGAIHNGAAVLLAEVEAVLYS